MTYTSYIIKFPKTNNFNDDTVTFSIEHIKSRRPSVVEVQLHCCKIVNDEEVIIETYVSDRWVITPNYAHHHHTFTIPNNVRSQTLYSRIELITFGIDNNNPLWFSEVMLSEGEYMGVYHTPDEVKTSAKVNFLNNSYANLYDKDGNYLQVIRPNKESFHTDSLDGAEVTILAPHFNSDKDFDSDVSVFIEALNQTNQTIDVLR